MAELQTANAPVAENKNAGLDGLKGAPIANGQVASREVSKPQAAGADATSRQNDHTRPTGTAEYRAEATPTAAVAQMPKAEPQNIFSGLTGVAHGLTIDNPVATAVARSANASGSFENSAQQQTVKAAEGLTQAAKIFENKSNYSEGGSGLVRDQRRETSIREAQHKAETTLVVKMDPANSKASVITSPSTTVTFGAASADKSERSDNAGKGVIKNIDRASSVEGKSSPQERAKPNDTSPATSKETSQAVSTNSSPKENTTVTQKPGPVAIQERLSNNASKETAIKTTTITNVEPQRPVNVQQSTTTVSNNPNIRSIPTQIASKQEVQPQKLQSTSVTTNVTASNRVTAQPVLEKSKPAPTSTTNTVKQAEKHIASRQTISDTTRASAKPVVPTTRTDNTSKIAGVEAKTSQLKSTSPTNSQTKAVTSTESSARQKTVATTNPVAPSRETAGSANAKLLPQGKQSLSANRVVAQNENARRPSSKSASDAPAQARADRVAGLARAIVIRKDILNRIAAASQGTKNSSANMQQLRQRTASVGEVIASVIKNGAIGETIITLQNAIQNLMKLVESIIFGSENKMNLVTDKSTDQKTRDLQLKQEEELMLELERQLEKLIDQLDLAIKEQSQPELDFADRINQSFHMFGYVKSLDNEKGVAGVNVHGGFHLGTAVTDENGLFCFPSVTYGTSYSLVLEKPGYLIAPSQVSGVMEGPITHNFRAESKRAVAY